MKTSFEAYNKEKMAFAGGRSLPISTQQSVEICKALKKKKTSDAKKILTQAIEKKKPIRFTRYNDNIAHKPGIGPGKYPVSASKAILQVIKSAEANAQVKGLGTDLVIIHMNAHKAARPWHYGRQRRTKMKRSHIEVVVAEAPKKDEKGKHNAAKHEATG